MNYIYTLTINEFNIMSLLWSQDRGLTAQEINKLSPNKSWEAVSIHLIINRMLDKGVIRIAGKVKAGRTKSRLFEPAISLEEYSQKKVKEITNMDTSAIYTGLFSAMIGTGKISQDDLAKIEAMIENAKKKD